MAVGATFVFILGFVFIGAPVLLIGGVVFLVRRRRGSGWTTVSNLAAHGAGATPAQPPGQVRRSLAMIRTWDPDFSVALFDDFAYALYAEAHTARGAGTLDRLAPYLGPSARATLAGLGQRPVSAVIVGAMRYTAFDPSAAGGAGVRLTVEFESCYTEATGPGQAQSYYAFETWQFVRSRSARSRPPDRVRVFACPSCGAPLDRVVGSTCGYCNQVVDQGAFDWTVESITVQERSARPPILTGTTEEEGTSLATVYDPGVQAGLAALQQRDPAFGQQALFARINLMFQTMQTAWSSLAWESARPYLSDNLFQTNAYWITAYRAQGLRNVTQNARIVGLEVVRVESDRWFDALTVRLHATGLDFTLRDADGAVVGGNRGRERPYTEYWTLVRGATRRGPAQGAPACPNCGAPMNITMAALCQHCGVKVNSGEFDWVLSRIEQDEVYGG
jgi:hypothetical protein